MDHPRWNYQRSFDLEYAKKISDAERFLLMWLQADGVGHTSTFFSPFEEKTSALPCGDNLFKYS